MQAKSAGHWIHFWFKIAAAHFYILVKLKTSFNPNEQINL